MEDHLPDGRAEGLVPPGALHADPARREDFVRANTRRHPVPLCPEITLRVADEAFELWFRTEEELQTAGLPPPFWAFAWAGGQALARCVLDRTGWVAGRRVLDLGAGSGMVAIAAMRSGAAEALAADIDPWACSACAINAADNGVSVNVTDADLLDGPAGEFGTVLVGDLFYDRLIAPRVLSFLDRALAAGADILIGDPGRGYLPRERLTRLFEYRVPVTRALEDADIKRTAVWRLDPP